MRYVKIYTLLTNFNIKNLEISWECKFVGKTHTIEQMGRLIVRNIRYTLINSCKSTSNTT